MVWKYEKFKGDGAIYVFCPKCGFHHSHKCRNWETGTVDINYQYNYCPMCGEYLCDDNFKNDVEIVWNERDISELYGSNYYES